MLTEAEADRVIEARGLVLVPGLSTGLIYPPEIARCLLRAPIRIPRQFVFRLPKKSLLGVVPMPSTIVSTSMIDSLREHQQGINMLLRSLIRKWGLKKNLFVVAMI